MITIACLGSSSTAGKGQAFDWIGKLAQSQRNRDVRFLNFGVGGDLAHNALERLDSVTDARPDRIVVLIGGNDVLASVSTGARRFYRWFKHLSCEPSPVSFRRNMVAIAHGLKRGSDARIGFCSLVPIGEDMESADPFQQELNQRLGEYSGIIRDVAGQENLEYLPVYKLLRREMIASPGRALTSFRFLPLYRDAFRSLVLRKTSDEIAQMNGWRFHTDGVHLNRRGGTIVAAIVQQFIES